MVMISSPLQTIVEIYRKISRNDKIAFLTTFIGGVICHLFMLTNKIPNHDELRTYSVYGGTVISGRPFTKVGDYISGYFGLPSKEGLIAIIYIAILSVIICRLMKIRRSIICAFVGIGLVVFPTVASSLAYMYIADIFFLTTVLSCLAIWIVEKYRKSTLKKKIVSVCVAGLLVTMGLSMYQSGFMVSTGLIVLLFIVQELDFSSDEKWSFKDFLFKVLHYAVFMIVSLAFYYIVIKITTGVTGLAITDRKGIGSAGILTILNIPSRVVEAYKQFVWYFFVRESNTVVSVILPYITGLLTIIATISAFIIAFKKGVFKNIARAVVFITLMLCLPIAVEFIYIIVQESTDVKYHMAYCIVLWNVFILSVFDRCDFSFKNNFMQNCKNIIAWGCVICFVLIQWDNWLYTSNSYNAAYFTYEQTYSYFSNMVSRIQQTDGFTYETPIAIIGGINQEVKPETLPRLKPFTAQNPSQSHPVVSLPGELTLIATYAHPYFIKHFLGYNLSMANNALKEEIIATQEFQDMPVYPANGSVKNINGVIVVKQMEVE